MTEPTPVLALGRDPGGAEALLPLLEVLERDPGIRLVTYGFDHAHEIFARERLAHSAESTSATDAGRDWDSVGRQLLAASHARLVITATSFDPGPESGVLRSARRLGVPTLAVLDQWINYSRRFVRVAGEEIRSEELPDVIAVMDDFAVEEMIAEGFPAGRLQVVGQAALDRAAQTIGSETERTQRQAIGRQFGSTAGETLVVFFSQPLRTLYGRGQERARGYDEWDTLRGLLEALAVLSQEGSSPRLAINLHPKESTGKFEGLVRGAPFPVTIGASRDAESLIAVADVVVGMTSITLIKAFLVEKPVISFQPNLRAPDALMLGRAGYLDTVTTKEVLLDELREALGGSRSPGARPLSPCLRDGRSVARLRSIVRALLVAGESRPKRLPLI